LVSPAQRKHSCANSRSSVGDAGMRAPALNRASAYLAKRQS
jgi:hypothetical protein